MDKQLDGSQSTDKQKYSRVKPRLTSKLEINAVFNWIIFLKKHDCLDTNINHLINTFDGNFEKKVAKITTKRFFSLN